MPKFAARAAVAVLAFAPMLVVADGAFAQSSPPTVIALRLSEFRFTPADIDLTHGQTYLLRLTNDGKHGHDLSAKAFFQTGAFGPGSAAKVDNGDIDVPEGQTVEVEFTPASPGSYEMHCTRPMHSMLGMTGRIVVH